MFNCNCSHYTISLQIRFCSLPYCPLQEMEFSKAVYYKCDLSLMRNVSGAIPNGCNDNGAFRWPSISTWPQSIALRGNRIIFTLNRLWKLNTSASKHESYLRGRLFKCRINFSALLRQPFGKKETSRALNSLFVRCCACSPWGEATLLFHQIKWSEAMPFQEEPIKLFKDVYYCDRLWNLSHQIHWGVCFNSNADVCTYHYANP